MCHNMSYMLLEGCDGTVVSRAKTPVELDYAAIPHCRVWSVCLKGTEQLDDSGEMDVLAVVDWGDEPIGYFRIIQSNSIDSIDSIDCVQGRGSIISEVRDRLQRLHNIGKLTDYNDLPAIRVMPT